MPPWAWAPEIFTLFLALFTWMCSFCYFTLLTSLVPFFNDSIQMTSYLFMDCGMKVKIFRRTLSIGQKNVTLPCRRIQRPYRACLHNREGRPRSSFPVVALITSRPWSPTVQFTLKLGAFPGWRASVLLIPGGQENHGSGDVERSCLGSSLVMSFPPKRLDKELQTIMMFHKSHVDLFFTLLDVRVYLKMSHL